MSPVIKFFTAFFAMVATPFTSDSSSTQHAHQDITIATHKTGSSQSRDINQNFFTSIANTVRNGRSRSNHEASFSINFDQSDSSEGGMVLMGGSLRMPTFGMVGWPSFVTFDNTDPVSIMPIVKGARKSSKRKKQRRGSNGRDVTVQ